MGSTGLRLPAIIEIIRRLSDKYDHPLGLSGSECGGWAEKLKLPASGATILYTGCLYQAVPRIESIVSLLGRVDPEKLRSLDILASSGLKLLKIMRGGNEWKETLTRIVEALRISGENVAYLHSGDLYSGILYYDLGMEEAFKKRITRIIDSLENAGAEKVITVDPHTTLALMEGIKRYRPKSKLKVRHYLECIDPQKLRDSLRPQLDKVVIHDPCHLARDLKLYGKLRETLEITGVDYIEPKEAGEETQCCGGPLEMIDPETSLEIARMRLEELRSKGVNVVLAPCPICVSNLRRASKKARVRVKIIDLPQVWGRPR